MTAIDWEIERLQTAKLTTNHLGILRITLDTRFNDFMATIIRLLLFITINYRQPCSGTVG